MERFLGYNNTFVNNASSSFTQGERQRVLFRIKDPNEIQDQSREELYQVSIEQQSTLKQRVDSAEGNHEVFTQVNILKQLLDSGQKDKNVEAERTVSTKRAAYSQHTDENLLLSNMRLKQDNIKLFTQCIKLRKRCQMYLSSIQQLKNQQLFQKNKDKPNQLQRQVASLRNQVKDLSLINGKLEEKIKNLLSEVSDTSLIISKCDKMAAQCKFLQKQKLDLSRKVLNLEKQLQLSSSRLDTKSGSIYSTNHSYQSKNSEIQRDRVIKNMKLVHESEVRRLKAIIQQLKKELDRNLGEMGSRDGVRNR